MEQRQMHSSRRPSRHEHPSRRIVRVLLWTVLVGLLAYGGWRWKGARAYGRWRDQRLLDRAEVMVREEKLADAGIAARRLIQRDPQNVRAIRIMADIAEKMGLRDAILWRARIVSIEPWNETNVVKLGHTALRFQDYTSAKNALDRYPANQRESLFYHELAGAVNFILGDLTTSESHFVKALALGPDDEDKKLNLARVRMAAEDERLRELGQATLKEIPPSSTNYPTVLHLLSTDALRRDDIARARELGEKLYHLPNASFPDRLIYGYVLSKTDRPAFTNVLGELKSASLTNSENAARLLAWMTANGWANDGLAWVRTVPRETFKEVAASMAVADMFAYLNDWLGLRNWVRQASWGAWEPFRYAYDARVENELPRNEKTASVVAGLWQKAIDATRGQVMMLELLANQAVTWGMPENGETIWWAIANGQMQQENALMILYRRYLITDDTLGQYRVNRRLFQINKGNIPAKNNTVYLGLLLRVNEPDLLRLAEELYQQASTDAIIVSTYAFALHKQNRTREAVDKMSLLPVSELAKPSIALMNGYLLAHAGDRDQAREYLKLAHSSHLLPEEIKLLDEAKALARMN